MQSLTKSSSQSQSQSQHNPPEAGPIGNVPPSQSAWQPVALNAASLNPGDSHAYPQYHYFYYPGASELAFGPAAARAPFWPAASTASGAPAGGYGTAASYNALNAAHLGVQLIFASLLHSIHYDHCSTSDQ